MDVSDIFRGEHAMLDESRLLPLSSFEREALENMNLTLEKINDVCNRLDIDPSDLYYDPEGVLQPFCYWDGYYYYPFMTMDTDVLFRPLGLPSPDGEDSHMAMNFIFMKKRFYDLMGQEEWKSAIRASDKKVSLLVFGKLREKLPELEQKRVFLSEYERNEYGFDRLDKDMVREVLSYPTPAEHDIEIADTYPDEEGHIWIYRGVTPQSSPLRDAYSWTLDPTVAKRFATRFGEFGHVIERRVHKNDVKAYLPGEFEVLVFPEDIRS